MGSNVRYPCQSRPITLALAAPASGAAARAQLRTFIRRLFTHMPVASPPALPRTPAPLREGEQDFIKEAVRRFYGQDAVVRNFGPDPDRLQLHVETDADDDMRKYDCLGVLLTRFDRDEVSLEVTKRGAKVRGSSKLAYRQGVVL